MRCPNVQRCPVCNELLIHRGKRSMHESASYMGQIVHGLLPHTFTWNDVDGLMFRRLLRLLRFYEHKSPGQTLRFPQREVLTLLGDIMAHVVTCPGAAHLQLHPESGVFLLEGDPHEGNELGPLTVTDMHSRETQYFEDEEEALVWVGQLDAGGRLFVRDRLARRRFRHHRFLLDPAREVGG